MVEVVLKDSSFSSSLSKITRIIPLFYHEIPLKRVQLVVLFIPFKASLTVSSFAGRGSPTMLYVEFIVVRVVAPLASSFETQFSGMFIWPGNLTMAVLRLAESIFRATLLM